MEAGLPKLGIDFRSLKPAPSDRGLPELPVRWDLCA